MRMADVDVAIVGGGLNGACLSRATLPAAVCGSRCSSRGDLGGAAAMAASHI
jgi:glycerol-3-phosphate dehydrogenase